ncbi:arylsulfatase [Sphingomonas sp. R-74633]|uniref:arylsulfatase n=1 Tax=Sphingomonas sp. R-74633 TaxID=2751188 RepID=UPI0015D24202|nr:arylsulfatase [Sphingomonas sp. R-74633]NYT41928.1 arylsulfatase [Sphingomonas sp. R-74633]
MSRRRLLGGAMAAGVMALAAGAPVAAAGAPARPNVVVILVDDMGFSDIGPYGSEIPTPNLDKLAAGGLKFSQFYNTARCSCSRAALLTGTYPHQAGMGHLEAIAVPESQGIHGKLEDRVVTMAEVLNSAGYFTGMAGKWHLGMSRGVGPWQRGFDRSIASPEGGIYYPDQVNGQGKRPNLFIDGTKYEAAAPEVGEGEWYSPDLFVDWDSKFMAEAKAHGKPFFLYLPFVSAHFPLMAPPEDIARFKGKYMAGWDAIRKQRLERQKKLGVVTPDTRLPERLANTYDWEKLPAEARERFDTIMAIYAAIITRMDQAVGTMVRRLRDAGELDNTLILFLSDNGGNAESGPDGRTQGPGAPGTPTSTVFAGMEWATLQNTPFQYFKHYTEEGGISTPLIAHWPKGIAPQLRGSWNRTPAHLVDIMPTVLEATGGQYPQSFNGKAIVPMQGVSLAPAFAGNAVSRGKPIFWEHEGNRAVRDGKWKLVARFEKPWQLFDIDADRTELKDLAKAQPARVAAMAAAWDAWARASYVDPWKDEYDVYLKKGPRRNWGGGEVPQHPEWMDRTD